MINFGQIYEGWKNMLVPSAEMKSTIEKISAERMAICEQCPYHSKNHLSTIPYDHCSDCGCMLKAKTACLSCECPKKYWLAQMNDYDEEQDLKKKI
jgi:hypothetical protein